jgi:hypothetical protein
MLENRQFSIEGIRVETITVERCLPDYNDLAWQTFTLLTEGLDLENPGDDDEIARYFCVLMRKRRFRPGTVFANPCGVVRSPKADPPFLQLARQIQKEWYQRFNDYLASSQRVQRAMRVLDPLVRQLTHTGVLFIDNQHVFPDRWPDIVRTFGQEKRIRPGQRFGTFVVLEVLPTGQVRCKCVCGSESVKERKHLVSDPATSCGCSQARRQARQCHRRK